MANGEISNGRLVITASVGGLLLVAGILISIGKLLNTVEHHTTEIRELNAEVVKLREQIDSKTSGRYTSVDAARDVAILNQRLDQNLKRIERLEDRVERLHR